MFKKTVRSLSCLLFWALPAFAADAPLSFSLNDKVLIITARADEATSVVQRVEGSGATLRVVHLAQRDTRNLIGIWLKSPQRAGKIIRELEQTLLSFEPNIVLVNAPFDRNPGSQTAFLYLKTALYGLGEQMPAPDVYVYASDAPDRLIPNPPESVVPEAAPAQGGDLLSRQPESGDVFYEIYGEELWITAPLPASIDEMGVLTTYIFGYRKDVPFAAMPKIALKLFGNKMFAYNAGKNFHSPELLYRVQNGNLFIRIPLHLLKTPEVLFVSARNSKLRHTEDFGSWKVLEIRYNEAHDEIPQ